MQLPAPENPEPLTLAVITVSSLIFSRLQGGIHTRTVLPGNRAIVPAANPGLFLHPAYHFLRTDRFTLRRHYDFLQFSDRPGCSRFHAGYSLRTFPQRQCSGLRHRSFYRQTVVPGNRPALYLRWQCHAIYFSQSDRPENTAVRQSLLPGKGNLRSRHRMIHSRERLKRVGLLQFGFFLSAQDPDVPPVTLPVVTS